MDKVDMLKNKKVRVKEIPEWGTYLRKQWENHFLRNMMMLRCLRPSCVLHVHIQRRLKLIG
ncbi:DUF4275 family protein [Paenibacillus solisilvae]|uniref:DUF4275 family protein n=1 Tax=Paenibacillus solisilvae TaxID=2486751 RepID=A0ABW0VXK9_9BACL